jgi:hypothetical protein
LSRAYVLRQATLCPVAYGKELWDGNRYLNGWINRMKKRLMSHTSHHI